MQNRNNEVWLENRLDHCIGFITEILAKITFNCNFYSLTIEGKINPRTWVSQATGLVGYVSYSADVSLIYICYSNSLLTALTALSCKLWRT